MMSNNKILDCGIYQILNLVNNKCYIGQSTKLKHRKDSHFAQLRGNRHENKHLQRSWNKYGEANFVYKVLIYCEDFELTRYEQFFSDYYKNLGLSYNIRNCVDSNKGIPCSEESKQKMSEKQKGEKAYNYQRVFSDETRKRISDKLKGRKHSEEHRKNLAISLNGSGMVGKKHTEETKKKMSNARKKYWKENPLSEERKKQVGERLKLSNVWSEERKMAMSEKMKGSNAPNYGKSPSEETRKKISESLKAYCKNKKDGMIMNNDSKEFSGDFYNEDYFQRGKDLGIGWLSNYHFMPRRTFREAFAFIDYLGLDDNSYVLEVGTAMGFLVKCLRALEIRADGCDISTYALSFAPEGCWNSSDPKTWDEHADTGYTHIIIKDMLEHISKEQLPKMLDNFVKVAKKMMCVVPMGDFGQYRIPEYHLEISHLIAENEIWWINVFQSHGWNVVKHCNHVSGLKDNWFYVPNGNHVFVLEHE